MKKLIFALLVAFVSAISLVGCTEEEVAPNLKNGGGWQDVGEV